MKNLKKDNKGFSLVELIVVVLIMAIIAVALAPQVMKWVNNSRINADLNAAGNIKTAAQAGVASYQAKGNTLSGTTNFTINGKASSLSASGLIGEIRNSLDDNEDYKTKSDTAGFSVSINEKGSVTVTCGAQSKTLE